MINNKIKIKINKFNKIFMSCVISSFIFVSVLPIYGQDGSGSVGNQDRSADLKQVEPIDISQLFQTRSGDYLIILFEGKSFRSYLKAEGVNYQQLRSADMGTPTDRKVLDGSSDEKGRYFNIKMTPKDDHFVLSSDNTTVHSKGKKIIGRLSGSIRFQLNDGSEIPKGNLAFMYLVVENDNSETLYYIDERPNAQNILSKINIKYGDVWRAIDHNSVEWKTMPPWKKRIQSDGLPWYDSVRAGQQADANELKALFNQQEGNKFKYKIIESLSKNGGPYEPFDESKIEGNNAYTLKIKILNPTTALDANNERQAETLTVNLELKDTKTPFKSELETYTREGLTNIGNKIDALNLTAEEKTALGITDDTLSNLSEGVKTKEQTALGQVDSTDLKHRQIDITPFDGDDTAKAQAKQDAQAKRDEIQKPIKASLNKYDAVVDAISIAKNRMDEIKQNNKLTDEEKQKLIDQIKNKLKTQIDTINAKSDDNALNTEALKELNNTFQDSLKNEVKIEENNTKKTITKNNLDSKAQAKIAEINKDKSLIQSEKDVLINQVNQKLEEAKNAVNNAVTEREVQAQETQFDTTLSTIVHSGTKKKDDAKAEIDAYAHQKIQEVDNSKDLTTEEKDKIKEAITNATTKAKQDIDVIEVDDVTQPETTPQLNNLVQDGRDEIDKAISDNPAKTKPEALSEINQKKEALTNKVDGLLTNQEISAEDKNYYQSKIASIENDVNEISNNKELSDAQVNDKKALALKKLEAIDQIIEALVAKTKTINENNDLSASEKTSAIKAIRAQADTKLNEIKSATDSNQVNVDQTVTDITDYKIEPVAKQTAIGEINQAKQDKLTEINDKFTKGIISKTEKDNYISKVNEEANKAIEAIKSNPNISDDDLNNHKTSAITAINSVKPLGVENIKSKLEELANQKKTDISQNHDLIGPEKNDLIEEVSNKLEEFTNALNLEEIIKKNPDKSSDEIQTILNNKITELTEELKKIKPQGQTAKEKAIEDLNKHKDAKLAEIEKARQDGLIDENEKNERVNNLNNSLQSAIENIKNAQSLSPEGLNNLKDLGIKKIDASDDLISEKHKKLKDIDDKNKELTVEEKQERKNSITENVTKALEEINKANDSQTIDSKVNTSKQELTKIVDNEDTYKKQLAQEINKALEDKINDINGNANLSKNEQETYIKALSEKAQDVIKTINDQENAKKDALNKQKDAIVGEITTFKTPAKDKAKKAIEDALNAKISDINTKADKRYTSDERQAQISELQNLAQQALTSIESSNSDQELDTIINNYTDSNSGKITAYSKEPSEKPKAIVSITEKRNQKLKEIADKFKNKEITSEEKLAYEKSVNDFVDNALKLINETELNNQELAQKQSEANQEIAKINIVGNSKISALNELETKKQEKLNAILDKFNNKEITEEEKTEYERQVNEKFVKAQTDIANASADSEVNQAKTTALNDISAITPIGNTKTNARKEIEAIKNTKLKEIQDQFDAKAITQDEKDQYEKLVSDAVIAAEKTIADALKNQTVTDAKDLAINTINATKVEGLVKAEALKALNNAKDQKLQEIYHNPTLVDEEKEELKQLVLTEFENAKKAINDADSNDAVQKLTKQGIDTIDKLEYPKTKKKADAITELKNLKDALVSDITNNPLYTNEEKEKQISKLEKELVRVERLINTNLINTTNLLDALVQETKNNFNKAKIEEKDTLKYQAKSELEASKDAKIKAIEKDISLTTDEQNTLIAKVKEEYEKAKAEINSANTNDEVVSEKEKGIKAINAINLIETEKAKTKSIKALQAKHDEKLDTINKNNDLSDREKEVYKNELSNILNSALDSINKAQNITNQELESLKDEYASEIENINILAIDQAISDMELALKDKTLSIDHNKELTKEEKETLKNKINELTSKAKLDLKDLDNQDEINTLRDETIKAIKETKEEASAKKQAIAKLEILGTQKLQEINNHSLLSSKEKDLYTKQVNDLLNSVKEKIDNALNISQEELNKIVLETAENLKLIKLIAKDKPILDIQEVLQAKISEIDNNHQLTLDEKQALKAQANHIYQKAINDIKDTNKQDTINNISLTAISDIKHLKVTAKVRPDALKTLKDLFSRKISSITNDQSLTIEEKTTLINKVNQLEISVIKDLETLTTNTSINQLIADTSTKLSLIRIEEKDKVKEIAKAKIIAQAKLLEDSIYANQDITSKQTYELLAILHKNKLEALKAIDEALDNETVNSVRLKPVYISSVKNTQNKSTNKILPNTGYKHTFTYYLPLLLVSVAGLIKKNKKR